MTTATVAMPSLTPGMSFDAACAAVVDYLKVAVPLGMWSVSRYDSGGGRQLHLEVRDDVYGMGTGTEVDWDASFCQHMVSGAAPTISPDAMAVPAFAAMPISQQLDIGSYVGFPIRRNDGSLFGTLCGIDPEVKRGQLEPHEPLLRLLVTLLTMVLEADLSRDEADKAAERAAADAETDALTGLVNRRGWDRNLEENERRYRRFADNGSVIVVDLDHLKQINDTLGHQAGDEHIILTAQILSSAIDSDHLVARLGGDEFGVLLHDVTEIETLAVVEQLRQALTVGGVASSIGWSPYLLVGGFKEAWARADQAMYVDKAANRRAPLLPQPRRTGR